jgi:thiamine biosynthesis protein ThiI
MSPVSTPRATTEPFRFRPTHLLVHYNEIGLKGRNRGRFEEQLARNIRAAIAGGGLAEELGAGGHLAGGHLAGDRFAEGHLAGGGTGTRVRRLFGRIAVRLGEDVPWAPVCERLRSVFGIAYVMPAVTVRITPATAIEALKRAVGELLSADDSRRSFAIQCKRATKDLPFTSMDVQRELGAHVQALTGWPVDLEAPELLFRVEVVNDAAFLAAGRVDGPGGLPTGVAGRVVSLLSGGIDSPVAAYRLLRRGALVSFVHFHSYPHTGTESQEKVREIAESLGPPGGSARLYQVPFADLQREIVARAPEPLRVLLYRRFMLRAAERIARREGALALVTGESLGQVASQTLENIRAIDQAASLPVLRPLIGMDKLEIIAEARRIGTFDVSIEPHGDCCSFLMPRSPATRSTPGELEAAEAAFDVDHEVEKLAAAAAVIELGSARQPLVSRKD